MCNRYGYQAPISRLVGEFTEIGVPFPFRGGAIPNVEPREHIRPTNQAPVIRALDPAHPRAGVELSELRWWLIPFFHHGAIKDWKPMCTNARSETVATTATFREPFRRRRCLVPASHYFEWTGAKGEKVMRRFTKAGEDLFCFAGVWDRARTTEGEVESFALLTCAPGEDCAPYHNRQPVVLQRADWMTWLDLSANVAPLMRAGPAGTISVRPEPS